MHRPAVVTWFKVYAAFMVLLYVLVAVGGALILAMMDLILEEAGAGVDELELKVQGWLCLVMGIGLTAAFVVGLLTPRRPWAWVFSIVLIALGLTSCCTWPATIPLLIFFLKSETRQWYADQPPASYSLDHGLDPYQPPSPPTLPRPWR